MENGKSICTIIVTFNRKELLLRCLEAVKKQSFTPKSILIVDNASTDGTFEFLVEKEAIGRNNIETDKLIEVSHGQHSIKYYRLSSNKVGAGGFYTGLKLAHESGEYDAYWLMDDDGYPSEHCLEKQMPYIDEYKYVMQVIIVIDNHQQLSCATRTRDGKISNMY